MLSNQSWHFGRSRIPSDEWTIDVPSFENWQIVSLSANLTTDPSTTDKIKGKHLPSSDDLRGNQASSCLTLA